MVTGPFPLLQLMAVAAIVGVVASKGAPAANEWIAGQRVVDTAAAIHASLMRARSEAVSRGLATSITPVTAGGVASWNNGWYIANPDGAYNADPANPGVFIERHGPVRNGTISGPETITFTALGRPSGTALGIRITVSDTVIARCVTVDTAGRPRTRALNAADTCS